MNFTAKILKQRGQRTDRLYYLESMFKNKKTYFFVLIDPPKEKEFLKLLDTKNTKINLEDFAVKIVAKGYGLPSKKLKDAMVEKYGIVFEDE